MSAALSDSTGGQFLLEPDFLQSPGFSVCVCVAGAAVCAACMDVPVVPGLGFDGGPPTDSLSVVGSLCRISELRRLDAESIGAADSAPLQASARYAKMEKNRGQAMKNLVREKMIQGEKTLGIFMELGTATSAECLGLAGLDYLIIDTEHGPFDPLAALDFVRAARLYGITPFARVQEISRAAILKLLDAGAQGLIIPCVNTVEEAAAIVRYGKYAPLGDRGVANTAGSGFWYEDYASQGMPHYFAVSNRESMLIPQCETLGCLEQDENLDYLLLGETESNSKAKRDILTVIESLTRIAREL